MSDYDRCPRCREFGWMDSHTCPPAWEVYCPDYGESEDDASVVLANFDDEAVEKWADRRDSNGDYTIIGGESVACFVRALGSSGPWTRFRVEGETVPRYRAHKEQEPSDAPLAVRSGRAADNNKEST